MHEIQAIHVGLAVDEWILAIFDEKWIGVFTFAIY